ncbi:hypothetical protein QOT17_011148 [Balamuthia mandrillaris]
MEGGLREAMLQSSSGSHSYRGGPRFKKKATSFSTGFIRCVKSVDLDDLLSYSTAKSVRIKDYRLGLLYWVCVLAVLFFIAYYVLYEQDGWAELGTVTGTMSLALKQPAALKTADLTYCESSCESFSGTEPDCHCFFGDADDIVYTEASADTTLFVATKTESRRVQRRVEHTCLNGACTKAWTDGEQHFNYFISPEKFLMQISHEAEASLFLEEETSANGGNVPKSTHWQKEAKEIIGQLLDTKGNVLYESTPNQDDIFEVGLLLKAAGVEDIEKVRDSGAVIDVDIIYGQCKYLKPSGGCPNDNPINYYYYRASIAPVTNHPAPRVEYALDGQTRSLVSYYGWRFSFQISGEVPKFSFTALLYSLVVGYLFILFASWIVDFLVLCIIPGRKRYRNVKSEVTENFSKLRRERLAEKDLQMKIAKVTKLARFKTTQEVKRAVLKKSGNINDEDMDKLLMAVISVYGEELRDIASATLFLRELHLPSNVIRAHLLLSQLKEAYIVAVREESTSAIQTILEAAEREGNERVKSMCEKWLRSRSFRMSGQYADERRKEEEEDDRGKGDDVQMSTFSESDAAFVP